MTDLLVVPSSVRVLTSSAVVADACSENEAACPDCGRVACTLHHNFGAFLGKTTGLWSHAPFLNGQRNGAATDIDFGQLYGD